MRQIDARESFELSGARTILAIRASGVDIEFTAQRSERWRVHGSAERTIRRPAAIVQLCEAGSGAEPERWDGKSNARRENRCAGIHRIAVANASRTGVQRGVDVLRGGCPGDGRRETGEQEGEAAA